MLLGIEQERRRAPCTVRSCRRRWARGTGTSRRADSDRRGPSANAESHPTPGAPPRPGRPRARCRRASMWMSFSRSPCIIFDTGMPVARDTTSAISSAPTCVRSSFAFGAPLPCACLLGALQLGLELRDACRTGSRSSSASRPCAARLPSPGAASRVPP